MDGTEKWLHRPLYEERNGTARLDRIVHVTITINASATSCGH